jgi:hypothetical protein
VTDLRRGFNGLSAQVQTVLEQQPFSGHVFVFRGRRGDMIKLLWFDGDGVPVCQAIGAGPIHLAAGYGRNCVSDASAAFDAARRYRLAQAGEDLDARDRSLIDQQDSPVFMHIL